MKRILVTLGLITFSVTFAACGKSSSSSTSPGFAEAGKLILPSAITTSSTTTSPSLLEALLRPGQALAPALVNRTTGTWGDINFEIGVILTQQAGVYTTYGTNNLFKNMDDFDGGVAQVTGATCDATSISSATVPFFSTHATPGSFFAASDLPTDYNCKADCPSCGTNAGSAGKLSGNTVYGTYTTSGNMAGASSVYQGYLNKDTGDMNLRVAGLWGSYAMRADIKGNKNTRNFTMLLTKGTPSTANLTAVGTGSAAPSAGNYFLFKISANNMQLGGSNMSGSYYFCYDASTGNSTNDTAIIGSTSNCKSLKSTVDALTPLDITNDLPQTAFDMTISST